MQVLVRVYRDVLRRLLVIMFDSSVMPIAMKDETIEMEWYIYRERLDVNTQASHTSWNKQNRVGKLTPALTTDVVAMRKRVVDIVL